MHSQLTNNYLSPYIQQARDALDTYAIARHEQEYRKSLGWIGRIFHPRIDTITPLLDASKKVVNALPSQVPPNAILNPADQAKYTMQRKYYTQLKKYLDDKSQSAQEWNRPYVWQMLANVDEKPTTQAKALLQEMNIVPLIGIPDLPESTSSCNNLAEQNRQSQAQMNVRIGIAKGVLCYTAIGVGLGLIGHALSKSSNG